MHREKVQLSVKLATTQPTQFYLANFNQVKLSVPGMTLIGLSVVMPIMIRKSREKQNGSNSAGLKRLGLL